MSVRIGILREGRLKTVYLFNETKIKDICELLNDNFKKISNIEDLIQNGDIVGLGKSVEKSSFYHRDKGEAYELCKPYEEEVNSLEEIDTGRSPVDYYLVWTNKWNICETYTNDWTTVTKFLNQLKKK